MASPIPAIRGQRRPPHPRCRRRGDRNRHHRWGVLYQPPLQADIRVETTQETYRIGEEVVERLENLGPLSLCTTGLSPWSIIRQVDDEWLSVRLVTMALSLGILRPGDSLGFRWVAESDSHWEE
ncbi:MAG: hypothetical protein V3U30_00150 [Thermoplasmata archaeon]